MYYVFHSHMYQITKNLITMNHTRQKISYQYVNYSSLLPTQLQWLTSTKILQGLYMRSAIKNANTTRFGLNIKSSNARYDRYSLDI